MTARLTSPRATVATALLLDEPGTLARARPRLHLSNGRAANRLEPADVAPCHRSGEQATSLQSDHGTPIGSSMRPSRAATILAEPVHPFHGPRGLPEPVGAPQSLA